MPRPKGLAKTGGRQKGTPNRDNPLKTILHNHSLDYFAPVKPAEECTFLMEEDGNIPEHLKGKVFSEFDLNLMCMKAADRAKIEVDLLAYHTPKMSAIDADMDVKTRNTFFTDRLNNLAHNKDIPPDEE